MNFPSDIPDNCPPASAFDPDGLVVHRLVKSIPPTPQDFVRPFELPRKHPIPAEELCSFAALSVFADEADIPNAREFIPGFRKRRVVSATLTTAAGVILNTPSIPPLNLELVLHSHHDLWLYAGVDPLPMFNIESAA